MWKGPRLGCGRVDLIDLFDLARANATPVRQRELQAHLAACPPCTDDYKRLCALEEAFSALRDETSSPLTPPEISKLEVRLMDTVSQFDQARAHRLWQPQSTTAERRRVRRRSLGRKIIKWTLLILLVLLVSAGAWTAHSVFLGSGYAEEPLWRLAMLLPSGVSADVLQTLPVRNAEDLAGDILTEKAERRLLPLARRLAAASGDEDLSAFLSALEALAAQKPNDAFAAAALLYPHCQKNHRWQIGTDVLRAADEGNLPEKLEGLPETLSSQLSALLGTRDTVR